MSLDNSVETQGVGDPITVALAAGVAFRDEAKAARDVTVEAKEAVDAAGADIAATATQISTDKASVLATVSIVEAKRAATVLAAEAAAGSAQAADQAAESVNGVVAAAAASAQSADDSAGAAAASASVAEGFSDDAAGYVLQAQGYADDATDAAGVATTKAAQAAASAASIAGGPVTSVNGQTGVVSLTAGSIGAAPLTSPALTGTPTAPTPANATNSTQIATTAFVQALLTALIGTAPANLDTLQEIAAQLATDESAVAALVTTVAGKLARASNLSDLTDAAAARGNLSLGNVNNTSDANKPVSIAQQAALTALADASDFTFCATLTL